MNEAEFKAAFEEITRKRTCGEIDALTTGVLCIELREKWLTDHETLPREFDYL